MAALVVVVVAAVVVEVKGKFGKLEVVGVAASHEARGPAAHVDAPTLAAVEVAAVA